MRRRTAPPDRLLATVMFSDIVGSTELASEIGDRAWKQLLARHHAIVRRELKRSGGREIDTAGDGFFAIFDRPAQAIECASAVMHALQNVGLRIRVGIHMGECEVMGEKVGGISVHVGARVLGRAEPDQILVTGTVREVTTGSEIRFADKGTHELRGVPGVWRLFAVERTPAERTALEQEAGAPEPLDADAVSKRRRRTVVIAAVAAVAVAVGGAVAVLLVRDGSVVPIVPQANAAAHIDPSTNEVRASVAVGDSPTGVAVADGWVWVLSPGDRTVSAIDPRTGDVRTIGLPGPPTGIATSPGSIWITNGFGAAGESRGAVLRIGAATRRIEQSIPLANGVRGIAAGEGGVWVTNGQENTVTLLDPDTRAVSKQATVGEQPEGIALGEGSVWVAHVVDRTIWRLDPTALEKTREVALRDQPTAIAVGLGRVWVTSVAGNSLAVIDARTNTLVKTLSLNGPRGVAIGADAAWVAESAGSVVRIDAESLSRSDEVKLPGPAEGVAATEDGVWVSVQG